ncbi:MAG: hypothetical protein ABJE10_11510 [bacterium]
MSTLIARASAFMIASIAFAACRGHDEAQAATERTRDCSVLASVNVGAVAGVKTAAVEDHSEPDEMQCLYAIPGGVSTIEVRVQWHAGDAAWRGARAGKRLLDSAGTDMALGNMTETVKGLGDDAFVQSVQLPSMPDMPKLPSIPGASGAAGVDLAALMSGQAVLWIKRGESIVMVTVANQQDAKNKAIAVARAVLPRL